MSLFERKKKREREIKRVRKCMFNNVNVVSIWLRHYVTSREVAGLIPDETILFFNLPNPSSRSMVLGSTQPITETSTRNLPGDKGMPARKADNFAAICEPIV
jgi:hypothetical protein